MDEHATALVEAIDAAFVGWFVGAVRSRAEAAGRWDRSLEATATEAAVEVQPAVMGRLRELLSADIDEQRTTPLSVLRDVVPPMTAVLAGAGVPAVGRDAEQAARFPADAYDLTPATFADLGERVGHAGIAWGAAKAFAHKKRHGGTT